MNYLQHHLLSLVIFLPALGALFLLLIPREEKKILQTIAIAVSTANFLLSLCLFGHFKNSGTFELMELHSWISIWNINYFIGIDGVSLLLIVLTTLLFPLSFLVSVKSVEKKAKEFAISMLILETGVIGVFCSLDLFLFYVFWEVMLIPMYLIIGVWGGTNRIYAAIKFFLYTMSGSLLMLVGILYLYFKGGQTFNLLELYENHLEGSAQLWVFLSFALAFAVKVPLFPLHTWLPDAHVEAPTAGSVILAGVLLKLGTYGFFRFAMPLFPEAFIICQPYLIFLAVVGIVYGALVSMVQTDIKKLVAYSSVSHLGIVMLGLFALERTAMQGGLYQMINHGVSTGTLFLLVGVLYERTHSRQIADHSGLARLAPWYSAVFLVITFSSVGLPLTNGFVGEFLSLAGAFQVHPWAAAIGTTAVVLAAVYMLWLVERIIFGPVKLAGGNGELPQFIDINWREAAIFFIPLVLVFWMGIYPKPFLNKLDRPIEQVLLQMTLKEMKGQVSQKAEVFNGY